MFDQQLIQDCTVQTRREVSGKFILYHCSHPELAMLEIGTDTIKRRTPDNLQPTISAPIYFGPSMGWCSTVSFYAKAEDVPAPYECRAIATRGIA